jgi:hypothetical protein
MIIALILAAWIVVLLLVMGLCAAARVGDLQQAGSTSASTARPERSAHANVRPVRAVDGPSLARSGGVAA